MIVNLTNIVREHVLRLWYLVPSVRGCGQVESQQQECGNRDDVGYQWCAPRTSETATSVAYDNRAKYDHIPSCRTIP